MRRTVMALAVLSLLPTMAAAGEIFGTIKEGGKPAEGATVEITSSTRVYVTKTDKFGSYSVYVPETGKCKLAVKTNGGAPSIEVYSYGKSARYDLVVEGNTVRRK
jgi:hypothetical protein